jgi:hypothetical protein
MSIPIQYSWEPLVAPCLQEEAIKNELTTISLFIE